jgi:peptide/nickel transport system substrate-binding protein
MSYIRIRHSKTLVLTSLVVLLLVLLACGTAAPNTPEDTTSQSGATTGENAAPASDLVPTAVPQSAPSNNAAAASEGTLRLAFGELGNQVMVPRMTSAFGKDPLVLAYDSLVGSNTKGGLSQERSVASEWTLAEDNRSWTFKLRQGIKFQNGEDLTAQDAKFSIEQLILPDSGAGYAGTVRNGVESIEVVDDYTLVVHNPDPRPFFPWDVSGVRGTQGMIIPMDYFMSLGATQQERDNAFTQQPIGSGPYEVIEAKLGDRITLESWGDHWLVGMPKYQQVQY